MGGDHLITLTSRPFLFHEFVNLGTEYLETEGQQGDPSDYRDQKQAVHLADLRSGSVELLDLSCSSSESALQIHSHNRLFPAARHGAIDKQSRCLAAI